jgi:hypothetical protein
LSLFALPAVVVDDFFLLETYDLAESSWERTHIAFGFVFHAANLVKLPFLWLLAKCVLVGEMGVEILIINELLSFHYGFCNVKLFLQPADS